MEAEPHKNHDRKISVGRKKRLWNIRWQGETETQSRLENIFIILGINNTSPLTVAKM